jgi:ATP-dependent 26S proteasome regulatory subunit
LLEDWKNFLSTPRDSEELKGGAQDKNSCIIIATNNYDNIDPALFRRGRLGKKLNFN